MEKYDSFLLLHDRVLKVVRYNSHFCLTDPVGQEPRYSMTRLSSGFLKFDTKVSPRLHSHREHKPSSWITEVVERIQGLAVVFLLVVGHGDALTSSRLPLSSTQRPSDAGTLLLGPEGDSLLSSKMKSQSLCLTG